MFQEPDPDQRIIAFTVTITIASQVYTYHSSHRFWEGGDPVIRSVLNDVLTFHLQHGTSDPSIRFSSYFASVLATTKTMRGDIDSIIYTYGGPHNTSIIH